MGIVRSKKDRQKEQAEHPGLNKYQIFWKDESGEKKTVYIFWAKDDNAAKTELDVFLKKNELVNPDDHKKYFYGHSGGILCDLGNGMEEEFDGIAESLHSEESAWDKIRHFFMPAIWWLRDMKYAFVDFWFWYSHYDKKSNKSRQRYESWNLDSAILDILEFNIPVLIKDKNGVPNEFCIRARAKIHENEKGFDVRKSFLANPNSNDAELKLAEEMWNAELEKELLHVRLYRYYSDYGIIDAKNEPEYVKIDEEYRKTIPYKPGTDGLLDYEQMGRLIQREWNAVFNWFKQYGQMCWT